MLDVEAKKRSAAGDLAAGFVLLVVSAIGIWSLSTNEFVIGVDHGNDPGPGLLPTLLLGLLVLSSVGMMAVAGGKLYSLRQAGTDTGSPHNTCRTLIVPALMVITLLFYSQTMEWLGFLETTAVFALFWTIALGMQDFGRPSAGRLALWLVEGIVICAGIYAVFAWFIKIPLP